MGWKHFAPLVILGGLGAVAACSSFGAVTTAPPDDGGGFPIDASVADVVSEDAPLDESPPGASPCKTGDWTFCDDFDNGDITAVRQRWTDTLDPGLSLVDSDRSKPSALATDTTGYSARLLYIRALPQSSLVLQFDVRLHSQIATELFSIDFANTTGYTNGISLDYDPTGALYAHYDADVSTARVGKFSLQKDTWYAIRVTLEPGAFSVNVDGVSAKVAGSTPAGNASQLHLLVGTYHSGGGRAQVDYDNVAIKIH